MKKMLFILAVSIFMIFNVSLAFSDVTSDYWAYDQINSMQEKEILSGFPDGSFAPAKLVTNEQTAVILCKAFDLKLKEVAPVYNDITELCWSKNYISLAGRYFKDKDVFYPEAGTTRIEFAKAIIGILGFKDDVPNLELINKFKDKDTFSEEDKRIIAIAVENNIMTGNGESFNPQGNLTRAEACAAIYNVLTNYDKLTAKNDNKVVMTVNDEDVTVKDFNLYFTLQKKLVELYSGNNDVWNSMYENDTLYNAVKNITKQEIISNTIQLQKAKSRNIQLDEKTLNELKEYANSAEALEICKYYGISAEEITKVDMESKMISKMAFDIFDELDHSTHSHQSINDKVEKVTYSARHILLSTVDKTAEEKLEIKSKAEELLKRVKNSEDFAKLAGEFSEDAGSKLNGGLYENISSGEFVAEFEAAALATESGKIYPELVESTYGYHIIKTESKNTEMVDMDEESKNAIVSADYVEVVNKWVEDAKVEVNESVYKII